jgi:hypothetical protein
MNLAGAITPLFNILVGLACIVGGATGRLSLLGTHSGGALVVAGAVAVGLGVYQLWRRSAR